MLGGAAGGGMPSVEEMQQQEAAKKQMEEQRVAILEQILEPAAKDRMNRLKLVKKDKARAVEDSLIKAATSGQLRAKLSEEQLISMLDGVGGGGEGGGEGTGSKRGITTQRRNYGMDSDDDDNDDDLM
jgi:DNA-binding TFAR19-related protein (PDSD5 family)